MSEREAPLDSSNTDDIEPGEGQPDAIGVDNRSFFQNLPQFVIFPLIFVVSLVLLYVFFVASVEDNRSISEILADIKHGWRKDQPAFELAMRAQNLVENGSKFSEEDTKSLIGILNTTSESNLRTFLIEALGKAGAESLALEELLKNIRVPDANEHEKVTIIRGLGLSKSVRVVEPLMEELSKVKSEEKWEIRLNILTALANVAIHQDEEKRWENTKTGLDQTRDELMQTFRHYLKDPSWIISWNMALVLANDFQDGAGCHILHNLLDRKMLGRHISEQDQELWMERAIEALTVLKDVEAKPILETLVQQDRSTKVRNAIFKYQVRMQSEAEVMKSQLPVKGHKRLK